MIRLEGRDALDLLHRLSTQFLSDLTPAAARPTLFCDFRGRLLHRAVVARTGDGAVWLLRGDAPGAELAAFIERSVFRDDVRVSDLGARYGVRDLPGGRALAPGTVREEAGVPSVIQLAADFALEVGGGALEPDPQAEVARVRAGRPRHGHEIAEAFTPFEVGLAHEVHLNKGCFTGQEALMRLVTYRSVRRRLARVDGDGLAPEVPADVTSGGQVVGRLTSAAANDRGWIGLAVLKHDASEAGATLEVAGAGAITGTTAFPFTAPLGLP